MHVVFRSLLKIFLYAAKQACVLNTTGLLKSQPSNVALQIQGPRLGQPNEDLGGHIYTVTNRLIIIDTDDE